MSSNAFVAFNNLALVVTISDMLILSGLHTVGADRFLESPSSIRFPSNINVK